MARGGPDGGGVTALGFDTRTLWYLSRGTGMITLMLLTLRSSWA